MSTLQAAWSRVADARHAAAKEILDSLAPAKEASGQAQSHTGLDSSLSLPDLHWRRQQ
jgi:hypothetical protein